MSARRLSLNRSRKRTAAAKRIDDRARGLHVVLDRCGCQDDPRMCIKTQHCREKPPDSVMRLYHQGDRMKPTKRVNKKRFPSR